VHKHNNTYSWDVMETGTSEATLLTKCNSSFLAIYWNCRDCSSSLHHLIVFIFIPIFVSKFINSRISCNRTTKSDMYPKFTLATAIGLISIVFSTPQGITADSEALSQQCTSFGQGCSIYPSVVDKSNPSTTKIRYSCSCKDNPNNKEYVISFRPYY
jgi:hypothetical protein